MKRTTIAAVCLSGAFALSAVVVTGAPAETLPAFYQCVATKKVGKPAKYPGHYGGEHCEESTYGAEGGQEYELEPWSEAGKGGASKVKELKGKTRALFFEIHDVGPLWCSKGRDTDEVTGPKTLGDIQIVLTHCELDKVQCSNTGNTGEIRTNTLTGEIGYFDEVFGKPVARGVGVDLTPESGSREIEGVECEGRRLWVEGSVIGEVVPPYNVFTKELKIKFQQSAARQAIQSFEGTPKIGCTEAETTTVLCTTIWSGTEWLVPEDTGLSGELVNKGEDLELKA